MPYICRDCKNKEEFSQEVCSRVYRTDVCYIDQSGEEYDRECGDSDNDEDVDWSDIECENCGSRNVEDVDDDVWEEWNGPPTEKEKTESWKDFLKRKK